jgi:hypothetical protein
MKLTWTPNPRCLPQQSMQRNTPKETEHHVGFFAGQSKQVLFSGNCRHRKTSVLASSPLVGIVTSPSKLIVYAFTILWNSETFRKERLRTMLNWKLLETLVSE